MPKQIFEINSFDRGIISNPDDELDIPDNAASYSLNVDPLTKGELAGIPKSTFLKRTGFKQHYELVSYRRPASRTHSNAQQASNMMNQTDYSPQ